MKNNIQKIKFALLTLLLALNSGYLFAQSQDFGKITTAVNGITSGLKNILDPLIKLLYALSVVVAIAGIIICFKKFNEGDERTHKYVASFVGGFIFLIAAASLLKLFA